MAGCKNTVGGGREVISGSRKCRQRIKSDLGLRRVFK
jgi:hypothetical protein